MPVRATKRGQARTPLSGSYDAIICGASFAGLAVARELAGARRADGSPARVLMIDRYEIGERQTSACGIPTVWLEAMDLMEAHLQTFHELVVNTPRGSSRWPLPFSFSTFDYRRLCDLMFDRSDCAFETAKVSGRTGEVVHTDRGDVSAPLIVDCLGWRRMLAADGGFQPPDAPLSRGLEVHPGGADDDLTIWIDKRYVPAGYGWSFPARDELRIGVGSFDPRFHVKEPTVRLTEDLGSAPEGYQGNWIPHQLRPATEGCVFFAGDSAGHCLPLTAEGIRTAFYFGIACGRELRAVIAGERSRRRGPASLHALPRLPRVEVPLAAARPAAGAAPAPPGAAGRRVRDDEPPPGRLVLRALPAHRAAGPRVGRTRSAAGAAQRSPEGVAV